MNIMIEHNTQIIADGMLYTQVVHSVEKPLAMMMARSTRGQSTRNVHIRALVRMESTGYAVYANKVIRRYTAN